MKHLILITLMALIVFASCKKDEITPEPEQPVYTHKYAMIYCWKTYTEGTIKIKLLNGEFLTTKESTFDTIFKVDLDYKPFIEVSGENPRIFYEESYDEYFGNSIYYINIKEYGYKFISYYGEDD